MKITKEYIINTYYNGIHPTCKCGCGTLLSFKPLKNGPWFKEYTKNHVPKKKHTEETKQKISKSCREMSLQKYGVENPFQSPEIKQKIEKTNLKRYGVKNYAQTDNWRAYAKTLKHSDDTKLKIKSTNQSRYGANSFTASDLGKQLIRQKNIQRYYKTWNNYIQSLQNSHIDCLTSEEEFYRSTSITFKCQLCNTVWQETGKIRGVCEPCQIKISQAGRSKLEASLFKWLTVAGIPFVTNKIFTNSNNKKYSLDVYFEEHSLGIEMNGLWWHSELHGKKDKHYHLDKLSFFQQQGVRVINIFEDEWNNKAHIIKSKILHILKTSHTSKIFARKCTIREITARDCREFIENNHIQGFTPAQIYLGAYYRDVLVGCMTFIPVGRFSKISSKTEFELVRFVTDTSLSIPGLGGKLLKHFIRNYVSTKIVSYADRRFTDDSVNIYTQLSFLFIGYTPPNYYYIRGSRRFNRVRFQKHKLQSILPKFDVTKSEWENMKNNGYDRLWDCGHLKYELTII